jgi:hypothetical protein
MQFFTLLSMCFSQKIGLYQFAIGIYSLVKSFPISRVMLFDPGKVETYIVAICMAQPLVVRGVSLHYQPSL